MRYVYDWNTTDLNYGDWFDINFAALLLRLPCLKMRDIYVSTFSGQVTFPEDIQMEKLEEIVGEELKSKVRAIGAGALHREISQCIAALNMQPDPLYPDMMELHANEWRKWLKRTYSEYDLSVAESPIMLRKHLYEDNKLPVKTKTAKGLPSVSMEALETLAPNFALAQKFRDIKSAQLLEKRLSRDISECYWPGFIRANEWYKTKPIPLQDYAESISDYSEFNEVVKVGVPGLEVEHLISQLGGTKFRDDWYSDTVPVRDDKHLWDCLLLKASLRNIEIEDVEGLQELANRQEEFKIAGQLLETYPELVDWMERTESLYRERGSILYEDRHLYQTEIPVECFEPNNSAQFLVDWLVVHGNLEALQVSKRLIGLGYSVIPYMKDVLVFGEKIHQEDLDQVGVIIL